MAIITTKHACWKDFVGSFLHGHMGGSIFRGQSDPSWGLVAGIYRQIPKSGSSQDKLDSRVYEVVQRFIKYSQVLPGVPHSMRDEGDALVIGQHYGLQTPLLDWTLSPFIAAFFAYADFLKRVVSSPTFTDKPQAIIVWELQRADRLPNTVELIRDIPNFAYRQKAQDSVFTKIVEVGFLDLRELASFPEGSDRGVDELDLVRHQVPSREFAYALDSLKLMNIHFASLFPDHYGAAKQANLEDKVRSLAFDFRIADLDRS